MSLKTEDYTYELEEIFQLMKDYMGMSFRCPVCSAAMAMGSRNITKEKGQCFETSEKELKCT